MVSDTCPELSPSNQCSKSGISVTNIIFVSCLCPRLCRPASDCSTPSLTLGANMKYSLMWIPLGNSSLDSSWPSWSWCSHQHLSFYQGIFHMEDSEVLNTDQELSHQSNHQYLPATDSQPRILRLNAFSKGPGRLIWKKSYPMSVKFSVMDHEYDLEHSDTTDYCVTDREDLWLLNFCKLGAQAKPISGLILQPAMESGSNHYRRVGFYRLKTSEDSKKLFQTEARQWMNLI